MVQLDRSGQSPSPSSCIAFGCIGGHNWTAYRPGTQFGYGKLSLKMHACVMRARERATPMRYRYLRYTFCEIYAPIRCNTHPYKRCHGNQIPYLVRGPS